MSAEKKDAVSVTPAVEPPATTYHEAAQAFVAQVHQMRENIPHFTLPSVKAGRQSLITVASLPPEFIELAAVARMNNSALVRGDSTTPAQSRDLMDYAEAFEPFADELEALAQFVRFSTDAAKSKAGYEALTTYSLARRLSTRPEHSALVPYVADLRRALGRGARAVATRRKKQREAAAATPPDSPAEPGKK